jgi:hypothetical protein
VDSAQHSFVVKARETLDIFYVLSLAGFDSRILLGAKLSELLDCELEVPDIYSNIVDTCFNIRITDDMKSDAPDKINLKVSF